jgi:hypothetical protein
MIVDLRCISKVPDFASFQVKCSAWGGFCGSGFLEGHENCSRASMVTIQGDIVVADPIKKAVISMAD